MKHALLVVGLVVAVAACGEATPTQIDDLEPAFSKVGGSQGPLVTGSGHMFLPDPFKEDGESLRDFTVSVVEARDGVTGHMHLGSVANLRRGLSFIGEVTCATVVDNNNGTKDAWIGGTNKHTNYGGNDLGAQFAVRVRDGGDVGPDRVSGVLFEGLTGIPNVGDWACDATPGMGAGAIDAGNIKIR